MFSSLRPTIFTCLVIASIFTPFCSAEARTFTNKTGQTIESELVGFDREAGTIQIRRADGFEFNIPLSGLSSEDQQYFSEWKKTRPSTNSWKGATHSIFATCR